MSKVRINRFLASTGAISRRKADELIEHGRTGYLFQPRDAGALARALRAILQTSAAELRTVGAAGQAYVLERHDKRGYLDFYAELLQRFTSQPVR